MGAPEIPPPANDAVSEHQAQIPKPNNPVSIDSAIDNRAAEPKTPESRANKPLEKTEPGQSSRNFTPNESDIDNKVNHSIAPENKVDNPAENAEKNQSLPSDANLKHTTSSVDNKVNQSTPPEKKIEGTAQKTDKNPDQKSEADAASDGKADGKTEHIADKKGDYKLSATEYENIDKALNSQIASLEKLKGKNLENGKGVVESATASLEKINSTGETVDALATVAKMAVDLKGMASVGSKAMKAIGDELKDANKELTVSAAKLAMEPIKDAIKGQMLDKVNSKLDSGFMKDAIKLSLSFDKPSYWAQKIAGALEHSKGDVHEIHKDLVNMVNRNISETNDKIDAKIYEIKQQQMKINNDRDALNMSIDHK